MIDNRYCARALDSKLRRILVYIYIYYILYRYIIGLVSHPVQRS